MNQSKQQGSLENSISKRLEHEYKAAIQRCSDSLATLPVDKQNMPANPLLISPSFEYPNAALKIMYFGQETNGWEGVFRGSEYIDELMGLYDGFTNQGGGFNYGGQFWNAVRSFHSEFKFRQDKVSFIWNNLIKIGKAFDRGTPCKEVLKWQEHWCDVIRNELIILRPNVVIFLSGPNYDWMISKIFSPVVFEPIDGYNLREVARVKSDSLPLSSFRTYHPGYLYRFGFSGVRDYIVNTAINEHRIDSPAKLDACSNLPANSAINPEAEELPWSDIRNLFS